MCEILIRVRAKENPDPYLDAKALKRGDVVAVVNNGWVWSTEELTNPDWRIVKLPSVSVSAGETLLAKEYDIDPQFPSKVLRRRAFYWNIDDSSWSTPVRNWINDDSRSVPTRTVNISETQFLALKIAKVQLNDPGVL